MEGKDDEKSQRTQRSGRRVREGDAERMALEERERLVMREAVREFEARMRTVVRDTLTISGIDNPNQHRMQHMSLETLLPQMQETIVPYVASQLELTKERLRIRQKITDSVVAWAVGGVLLFLALCVFYGGKAALEHMAEKGTAATSENRP